MSAGIGLGHRVTSLTGIQVVADDNKGPNDSCDLYWDINTAKLKVAPPIHDKLCELGSDADKLAEFLKTLDIRYVNYLNLNLKLNYANYAVTTLIDNSSAKQME